MDYLPQPYPLWCATVEPDRTITVGRIVAWTRAKEYDGDEFELVPVVMAQHNLRVHKVRSVIMDDDEDVSDVLFIADTDSDAQLAARLFVGQLADADESAPASASNPAEPAVDLMAALRASVERAQATRLGGATPQPPD